MTLAQAQANLAAAQSAYTNALDASSVAIGSRSISRQRIAQLAAEVERWDRMVQTLTMRAAGADNPTVATAKWSS